MSITSVSARAAAAMQGSAPGFANATAGFAAALEKYAKELDRQTRDVAAIAASANAGAVKPTPATLHSDGATEIYDVGTGQVALDIDAYFTPPRPGEQVDLNTLPLLMPTENNLRALSQHIAKRLPDALKAYDIPSAPAYVRYDNMGKVVLPDNYPYADKFKAMLNEQPALSRQLSALNGLTSHLVELRKVEPFQREYAAANTQAEIDAVLKKYSYLFSGQRTYSVITISLSSNGAAVSLSADDKPVFTA
jgi:hypothetical protein